MEIWFDPPSRPEQYLHIYVDAIATNQSWDRGRPDPQIWMFPDPDCENPVETEEYRGTSCASENIPQELIRIATEKCPFLGAQVELMFKELGIYEADPKQPTK